MCVPNPSLILLSGGTQLVYTVHQTLPFFVEVGVARENIPTMTTLPTDLLSLQIRVEVKIV